MNTLLNYVTITYIIIIVSRSKPSSFPRAPSAPAESEELVITEAAWAWRVWLCLWLCFTSAKRCFAIRLNERSVRPRFVLIHDDALAKLSSIWILWFLEQNDACMMRYPRAVGSSRSSSHVTNLRKGPVKASSKQHLGIFKRNDANRLLNPGSIDASASNAKHSGGRRYGLTSRL